MADFSLTTLFVVPTGSTTLPTQTAPAVVSTQDLGAGAFGFFRNDYTVATAANVAAAPYFYIAQGRANSYLQGSKRSDKIKGCATANCNSNITEFYKVVGCPTAAVQITEISNWTVQCGDVVTITLRAHSSYIDTLYFNGWTRSVTVQAPCCDCGADPCADVNAAALVDEFVAKFQEQAPGNNSDNSSFNSYFTFQRVGAGTNSKLVITGKPLTKYGVPCDVAAFPHEYDRMWFRTFVYEGPATTADFIVDDACNEVADVNITQRSSYPTGTSEEIAQLEKNYYSYQAGYLKHLYRMAGYNQNFESYVVAGASYTTYYLKYNELPKDAYNWGDYIPEDSMAIIAVNSADAALIALIDAFLVAALGATAAVAINACITTTSTTTAAPASTTTTTSTLIP
jgi:hypothetical protein